VWNLAGHNNVIWVDGSGNCSMAVILLVEDEEQVRVLAESYLEEQGHEVLSAGSPDGAMALLKRTPHVDVLFTDIDLKDKIASGIELAQDAAVRWPHLKVLYTTGKDLTDGMKARFVENSAFLPKPYTVEELLRTLSEHFKISPQPRNKS
jgi:DNA-binding NtrC family response regulator